MEGLGINLGYLIVQIGAIIILVTLMKAFAYGPITRLLEERQARIAKGLEDARQAAIARDDLAAERAIGWKEEDLRWLEPDEVRKYLRVSSSCGGVFQKHVAAVNPAKSPNRRRVSRKVAKISNPARAKAGSLPRNAIFSGWLPESK